MVELTGNIPFMWRLSAESGDGGCAVSMVVPFDTEDERQDLTIETSVISFPADASRAEEEEVLEWNQDDISLFLKLVAHEQAGEEMTAVETVRVDLTDPAIIEIIHVVAAAGFGMAFSATDLLRESAGRYPSHPCDMGSFAALDTIDGFKRCVVVDIDGEDAVCVLLDSIDAVGESERLKRHDLLMVRRGDLLHPHFATTSAPPADAILH